MTTRSRRPSWLLRILILTFCVEVTFLAVALNLTDDAPAGMNTLEGTGRTVELLLESENEKPPEGATAPLTRLILISVEEPEVIVEGVAVMSPYAGATATDPVELTNPARPGLAPVIGKPISGRPSRLKSPVTIVPPPTLEFGGGAAKSTGAPNVPSPFPRKISNNPSVPFASESARSRKPSRLKSAMT